MLQRAASNAYSWWWASHIRTKQSKWLEQSLQDMEEKVNDTLQIINQDGDTFAKRAEMYYRKRPELVNLVEESFRAFRALAERYDHLSKEFQSANRTIATVFPEQVQYAMDDEEEDDENSPEISSAPEEVMSPTVPRAPRIPDRIFRNPELKRSSTTVKATTTSGLGEVEAVKEIDRLQKEILALQTEKEFVESSYEQGYKKYWEIEDQIVEKQRNVSRLQDEFDVGTVIDDSEARNLIAATALKSCQEALAKLREKHALSAEEARAEYHKIEEARDKLETIVDAFVTKYSSDPHKSSSNPVVNDSELNVDVADQERHDKKSVQVNFIKDHLDANSNTSISVTEMAEKIDELVNKVVTLTTAVSSQNALVSRLSEETDELHSHIQNLEEDKDILTEGSEHTRNKLHKLEEELNRVKNLNRSVEDQNKNLQTYFSEASFNLSSLSEELENGKLDEEVDDRVDAVEDAKQVMSDPDTRNPSGKPQELHQHKQDEDIDLSETMHSSPLVELEELGTEEDADQPNWSKLFANGLEDRELTLVKEYTSVLWNYKEVKKKLSEVEIKNRQSLFELSMQVKELKDANASREEQILSLHEKLSLQTGSDENHLQGDSQESISPVASSPFSDISSTDSPASNLLREHNPRHRHRISRSIARRNLEIPLLEEEEHDKEVDHNDEPRVVSAVEERIRTDIDELLEENMEFWLRFSTTIHYIQNFQTSVQDLRAELINLKKKQDGSQNSDARPIHKHLKEIQTDLRLWIERNAVLKDELHTKFSSIRSIQEAIERLSCVESEHNRYQAAKFQGEVLNMKQEIKKIADEFRSGFDRVGLLKAEVDKTLEKLDEELQPNMKPSSNRHRIPLRSFLFGIELKKQKQSMFSCMNPALQKQYSDLAAAARRPL